MKAPTGTSMPLTVLTVLCTLGLTCWLALAPSSVAQDEDDLESRFAGGAPLKTDPELESQMRRAEKFAEDREYGYAATVWQYVLDRSGDTLMTRDGRLYTSLSEEVERALAKLPPEGLRVYRITADGEAKALLARTENTEDALSEVVRRYFVSSYGDDAAYRLGCLALDQHDFVGASRMFTKILELHPDPSVSKTDILLRLAVAGSRVGDKAGAQKLIAEAEKEAGRGAAGDLCALIKRDVESSAHTGVRSGGQSQERLALSGASRVGHMPALPPTVMSNTLTELWGYSFPADFSLSNAGQVFSGGTVYYSGRAMRGVQQATGGAAPLARWRSQAWRPAGQLLAADGLVLFKTNNDLTAWNSGDIGLRPEGEQNPYWRTAWLNAFRVDAATQMFINMGMAQQMGQRPVNPGEVMLFGDRVHHAMSIADGVVYNVEGERTPRYGGSVPSQQVQQPQWGVMPRRSRKNWLAAYSLHSGKAKWHRSPSDEGDDSAEYGFLAAPVPYGDLLLVPVTDSGTIWLYALSRDDGSTVWKSYLCDEPTGGCSPWSPACVSVEGRDAYVVCGTGVVFALDAVSGHIRYAVRYERNGKPNQMMRNYGYAVSAMLNLEGWEEDVVIPYGSILAIMASDHDELLAIDRRTGEFRWRSPRTPFEHPADYCLGTVGGSLFVGGRNVIRRYDLASGLLKWEAVVDDSFGRAALTEDAIYVPVKTSIWKLDLEKGAVLGKVGVSLSTDDMVGNLYSDGERLWVHGGNRIYALTNLEHRLALLEKRIASGDPAAVLDRMRLWAKGGESSKAVADLELACDLIGKQKGRTEADAALLEAMHEIHLAEAAPRELLRLAAERLAELGGSTAPGKDLLVARRQALSAALTKIRRDKIAATAEVLGVAAQFDDEAIVNTARRALEASAVAADASRLKAAVLGEDATARIVCAEALARVAGDDAKPPLTALLAESDERLKLAGARALADIGDRTSLAPLIELMDSEKMSIRSSASNVLAALTGERFGYVAYDKPEARRESLEKWKTWLADAGKTAELKFPVDEVPPMLGRTLVTSYAQNLVIEFDAAGKQVWKLQRSESPWSVQGLPNGHRLISFYTSQKVVEFDAEGKEVWKKEGLGGTIFGAQRLENGNTLIPVSDTNQVIEVKPDGGVAWQKTIDGRPMDAKRLANGNTLVCLANAQRVVEVNREGEIVWQLTNMNGPIKAQRLENGNTLVVQMNTGKVVEMNREGTQVWSRDGFSQPYDAQRLPSGNTLIIDNNGAKEYDPSGHVVWEHRLSNGAGVTRY